MELSANPYSAPNLSPNYSSGSNSGALTAIGIVSIVMGALGFLTAEMGIAGLLAQPFMQSVQERLLRNVGPADEQFQAQQRMQQDIVAATQRFLVPQLVAVTIKFFAELALIVAGICVLRRRLHSFTVAAVVVAMCSDAFSFAVTTFIQLQMAPVMQKNFEIMMEQQPNRPKGIDPSIFLKLGTFVAVGMGAAWLLMKLGFFGWSFFYLRRDSIRYQFPT